MAKIGEQDRLAKQVPRLGNDWECLVVEREGFFEPTFAQVDVGHIPYEDPLPTQVVCLSDLFKGHFIMMDSLFGLST